MEAALTDAALVEAALLGPAVPYERVWGRAGASLPAPPVVAASEAVASAFPASARERSSARTGAGRPATLPGGALLVEYVSQRWNGSEWVNGTGGPQNAGCCRQLYTYEGGLLVEFVYQRWDGSDWMNSSRVSPPTRAGSSPNSYSKSGTGATG